MPLTRRQSDPQSENYCPSLKAILDVASFVGPTSLWKQVQKRGRLLFAGFNCDARTGPEVALHFGSLVCSMALNYENISNVVAAGVVVFVGCLFVCLFD